MTKTCGCPTQTKLVRYWLDRSDEIVCEFCLSERLAIGDDPDIEWTEMEVV